MKFVRFFCMVLTLGALCGAPAPAQAPPSDGVTLVVFSRHTFRGIDYTVGPQRISLPQYGLDFPLPMLGYAFEASPQGLNLTQKFAGPAIQEAATRAVEAVQKTPFNRHWDEIRADLAASRCFFTALYIREGLQAGQKDPILLTGCPTQERQGIDAVSVGGPVYKCIPPEETTRLLVKSPNQERLRQAALSLVSLVGTALGKTGPYNLPEPIDPATGKSNPVYVQLSSLAMAIEMASDLGPPLGLLFPQASKQAVGLCEADAVRRASNYLGVRFTALIPMELAYAWSVFPLQYIHEMAGRHVIVLSHDNDISSLCRALDLISDDGNVDELAIYPMESIVFALTDTRASVVRMVMKKSPDGSLPGPFESRLMWQGSRGEWDAKVRKVDQQAQAWKAGAAERAKIRILPAPALDVLFEPAR